MNVIKLIEKLELLNDLSQPMFAILDNDLSSMLYVDVFGNSRGFPTIWVSEEEPLAANKRGDELLEELRRWKKQSIHYKPGSDVYLSAMYNYEDGSYDFRHFKLKSVSDAGSRLILIAEIDECVPLREHHEAFEDSMLADD